jgi:hypothetical protein
MKNSTFYRFILIAGIIAFVISACYYDNEEHLYPDPTDPTSCDTTNVTYSSTVVPILNTHCYGCHNPGSPFGAGIVLNTYTDLMVYVENGRFWGSISHDPGYSPMPKGGAKLSACNLLKIKKWIEDGAVNN